MQNAVINCRVALSFLQTYRKLCARQPVSQNNRSVCHLRTMLSCERFWCSGHSWNCRCKETFFLLPQTVASQFFLCYSCAGSSWLSPKRTRMSMLSGPNIARGSMTKFFSIRAQRVTFFFWNECYINTFRSLTFFTRRNNCMSVMLTGDHTSSVLRSATLYISSSRCSFFDNTQYNVSKYLI